MDRKYMHDRPIVHSSLLKLNDIQDIDNEHTSLIFDKLTYAIFGIALMPPTSLSSQGLERLADLYIQTMELRGDWLFAPDVEAVVNDMYHMVKINLPPRMGIKKAAKLLREQLQFDPFHNGIELGLITKIMDLNKSPYLKEGLPYYSRLGLGYHADRCVNEEWQLLSDAFFLISSAIDQYYKMFEYRKNLPEIKTKKHLNELTNINENVCSLCRTSIVSLYAFFESFVNGIGLNYLYYNEDALSQEDQFALQGKDRIGNHYLRIEKKLECLQKIIAKKVTYHTNNVQQLKEKSIIKLLEKMRERRDVAVHYSKIKGNIMYSPQEWMDEMIDISHLIIDVSRRIWDSCFPEVDHYPYYLRELDYEMLIKCGNERIANVK